LSEGTKKRIVRERGTIEEAIVLEWRALSQWFIDDSIDQWRRRLQCVCRTREWWTYWTQIQV